MDKVLKAGGDDDDLDFFTDSSINNFFNNKEELINKSADGSNDGEEQETVNYFEPLEKIFKRLAKSSKFKKNHKNDDKKSADDGNTYH